MNLLNWRRNNLLWDESERIRLRQKIPRVLLHRAMSFIDSEILVDEPHKFAGLAVEFKLAWRWIIVKHHLFVHVIFSRFWNSKNSAAVFKGRILKNVLVGQVVDAVEHHLVEENCIVGENKSASDCQRTSEEEVLVKKH